MMCQFQDFWLMYIAQGTVRSFNYFKGLSSGQKGICRSEYMYLCINDVKMQSTFLPFKKVEVSEYDNHPNSLMIIKV